MSEKQRDVTVRNQKRIYSVKTGEQIGTQRRVFAEFQRGGVPEWALPIAEKTFAMGGRPPEIAPNRWLSTYDSALDQRQRGWTDEERELIEAKLRSKQDVVEIIPPKLAAPWPTYDRLVVQGKRNINMVAEKIASEVQEGNLDVEYVVAYEHQNLNRPEVIAALNALVTEVEEEELIQA